MTTNKHKTVSLVLGSGGARGLAHIGVIHWLEENNYKIKSISGCSIGALIGGVYAAGKLDEFEDWVKTITKMEIVKSLDFSWGKSGLFKGDKIITRLTELVGDKIIEDLPIVYTAVATDLHDEKEVWINSGKLFDAIRASISLPLFFTPYKHDGVDLIDGGVLNPVPIAPTFNDATDYTFAVNLCGKVDNKEKEDTDKGSSNEDDASFTDKITEFVINIKDSTISNNSNGWAAHDIANQAFDVMQSAIASQKLAAYPADQLIEISRNACGILEFDRASEMIALGYKMADERLGDIS